MSMRLLIVDDSELILASLLGWFKGMPGIEAISTASTLVQTLECVRVQSPTLIILDLHLTDGNATSIIGSIKQVLPSTRISVLTNDANAFNRRKCMEAGSDWFFDKSTEFEELVSVVQQQAALSH